jgi:hypothetical protein
LTEVVALRRPGELGVVLNYQKAGTNVPWTWILGMASRHKMLMDVKQF